MKIGSAGIIDQDRKFRFDVGRGMAGEIIHLKNKGKDIVLVSSGAVALGLGQSRPVLGARASDDEKRVAAKRGQKILTDCWGAAFAHRNRKVREMLVDSATDDVMVPWTQENRSIWSQDIFNGRGIGLNNDVLASSIARASGAQMLIILSDVEGYLDHDQRRISFMRGADDSYCRTGSVDSRTGCVSMGTGGMVAKIQAIRDSGAGFAVIAKASSTILGQILAGEDVGTLFELKGNVGKWRSMQ